MNLPFTEYRVLRTDPDGAERQHVQKSRDRVVELYLHSFGIDGPGLAYLVSAFEKEERGPALALHDFALTMLGIHLIDRADLAALSEMAQAQGRWEFMLTIAPLPIPNGTGSPVNPIAMF